MSESAATLELQSPSKPIRIGVVSFVNTLPLIDGLELLRDVSLRHSVPSVLLDLLVSGEVDVALCSSIDYLQCEDPVVILPAGLLGCDGPTLTVRLFSMTPIREISRVYCDTDSHTSVVLMRILLRERYGIDPELIAYNAREHVAENRPIEWPEAMLLIGDKVVTDSPPPQTYPHQLDLGDEWVQHTGLPFVFALWLARRDTDPQVLKTVFAVLDRQRRHNQLRVDRIVHTRSEPQRWPDGVAAEYLRSHIAFQWTQPRRAGLELFFEKAHEHGLIVHTRPLDFLRV